MIRLHGLSVLDRRANSFLAERFGSVNFTLQEQCLLGTTGNCYAEKLIFQYTFGKQICEGGSCSAFHSV